MEWQPMDTAPNNGRRFLCWNGEEMQILNQPKGHALGRWSKVGREWRGASVRFKNPTHWMELPTAPTKHEQSSGVDAWKVVCEHCLRFTRIRRADAAKAFGFKEDK